MENFIFFDLKFEQENPTVSKAYVKDNNKRAGVSEESTIAEEFRSFFSRNNLIPLFTDEHRAVGQVSVSWADASELIKTSSRPHRLLQEFANWVGMAQDNKKFQEAMYKILRESSTWRGFLKQIERHLEYLPTILDGYLHNAWNIVFYDKGKTGTKVSGGIKK